MTDISHEAHIVKTAICEAAALTHAALTAPSVIYRPKLTADGSKWCALYGDNLAVGVAGFGDTPEEAMAAFDHAWKTERTPAANLALKKSG